MTRTTRTIIVAGLTSALCLSLVCDQAAFAGRGGGGGGGRGGGGGGVGAGGGGARPSAPAARPSAPAARPSAPAARPAAPAARPSAPPSRPNVGSAPSFGGGNPGAGNASRPSTGGAAGRPSINPGTRPEVAGVAGNRPATGAANLRPGDRPQTGTLPGTRPGTGVARPGTTDRPGIANRPNTLPGMDNRLPNAGNRLPNGGANVQDRRNDLNGRFQDRGNWQNNRQDYQNNRREDWQNWADGSHHGDWYHGYSYGGWWNHGWENHPGWMAFGVTTWGLNRLSYGFGLSGYSNPYYSAPVGTSAVYDYSQPIVQQDPVYNDAGEPIAAPAASDAGMSTFDQARTDFYAGNYPSALDNINATLKQMPNDAVVHEFRALVLFALGRYSEAAATIHSVLAVGPGWDWPTVVGLYPSVDVYTEQLRQLETYVKANPNAADALFLMAYHYLTCDHKDAAHKTFEKVVSLQPKDTVAAQYVQLTNPESSQADAPTPEPPPAVEIPAGKLLSEKDLIGKWKASGPNSTTFNLEMTDQGQFTWTFAQGKNTQTMKGVFAIDQNQLALQPDSGGTMLADLTKKDSGFHFAMEGAPDKDPGLNFTK